MKFEKKDRFTFLEAQAANLLKHAMCYDLEVFTQLNLQQVPSAPWRFMKDIKLTTEAFCMHGISNDCCNRSYLKETPNKIQTAAL